VKQKRRYGRDRSADSGDVRAQPEQSFRAAFTVIKPRAGIKRGFAVL